MIKFCDSLPILDKPYYFMNQTVRNLQEVVNTRIEFIGDQICGANPEINLHPDPADQNQDLAYVCGMLFSGDEGERSTKLVDKSIMLRCPALGKDIIIDVNGIPGYSLFPGEVVCFAGKLIGGVKLEAQRLFAGSVPPLAAVDTNQWTGVPDKLAVIIASGPFTLSKGFSYEPLIALLDYVHKHRPQVLILVGPIVPMNHEDILALPQTGQKLFDQVMARTIEACSSIGTQLVVVASADDAVSLPCYPTPPANMPPGPKRASKPLFCPDPCLLRIGGITFGITSTDVMFHLISEELFKQGADVNQDRMSRLARHLLLQQTFYPLLPPSQELSIDIEKWDTYARLPVSPHVLVLPSKLKQFCKDVGNVLAVNPGHLAKGTSTGTFCRLEFDRRKLAHESGDVLRCIQTEIVKI